MKIICIGDSHTYSFGIARSQIWTKVAGDILKEEIINIQVISRECVKNLVLFFMYVLFVIALVRWINYTMLDNLELDSSMLTFVHFFKGRRYLYNFFCVLELFNNSTGIRYIYILI